MGTKIKGIKKGIKYISQIFVVKEQEMEIGYPTDVKHVAHIGWDSQNSNAPSWMNEFKTTPDFSSSNIGGPSWSSQDFEQSLERQQASEACNENPQPTDAPKVPKKKKLKKIKSAFSPKSGSSSRSSKALKSKTSFATALNEMERQPNLHGLTS